MIVVSDQELSIRFLEGQYVSRNSSQIRSILPIMERIPCEFHDEKRYQFGNCGDGQIEFNKWNKSELKFLKKLNIH